jgi:WD40 repeat protein
MVIKIVTLSDMQCRELNGHDGAIRCICFDPQLETLVRRMPRKIGVRSDMYCCHHRPTQCPISSLPEQISTSDDGFLRLWKVESGECLQEQAIMAEARGGSDP